MVASVIPVKDFDLVLFGATGDLAQRKIFPALYRRRQVGQMPQTARIIALARQDFTDATFREHLAKTLKTHAKATPTQTKDFLNKITYIKLDINGTEGWDTLTKTLRPDVKRAFYFSIAPDLFGVTARKLIHHNLAPETARLVVEKPFGRDLPAAQKLNATLAECFNEKQIFRIDHYLGKETVQNLMALRFGNSLFEPLWNAHHIDHVQITAAESLGVGGRGGYYDQSGALRDMVQNHMVQLLCLCAMEPPTDFTADSVRDEKLKIIKALEPVVNSNIVRGQYDKNTNTPSYKTEVSNANSTTECFIALRVDIANWRWAGVPFYLRTGKRLRHQMTEIAIVFKKPPHSIFGEDAGLMGNVLTIRLQPDEGITLRMTIKDPGPGGMRLREVPLDMSFASILQETNMMMPDAYERLIMDVIRGDQTLFMRGDEVESAWAWVDPICEGVAGVAPDIYEQGSAGPCRADDLLARDGRVWRDIGG